MPIPSPIAKCLLVLLMLSACTPMSSRRQALATAKSNQLIQRDFALKSENINYLRTPQSLSRYVCGAVSSHLQDQLLLSQNFSDRFLLSSLGKLPGTLQRIWASCYLEQESKHSGFEVYFRNSRGLLVAEAITAYHSLGAEPQAKILATAYSLWQGTPASSPQKLSQRLAGLDALWRQQDPKALMAARGQYIRRQLQSGTWPLRSKADF